MEWPEDFAEDHAFVELLVPGVSSDLDFEQLMKDTEEKLNLNANSIEQQLKELQAKIGDSRTAERPLSPTEWLQWFSLKTQQSVRPVTQGHQELMDFFRALQQYLRSEEESKEEVTLQLLLNLSSQCGICFPCNHSSSSPLSSLHSQLTASSIQLVHTVREDASLEIQEVWDDVRLRLRRYLMDQLFSCSPELPGPRQTTALSILERVQCLQQMFFLYPESEVLQLYQGLKRQYVLGILHSTLSASQIGETGFDRLAMGFCSMVPILTQALKEELHVLSGLAEAHTILGFINEAYLNTVATEFASLMERECETAHRDNTAPSVKTKKYSVKSRATVAPLELPTKSRSFSLTSHQLRALTQLACTLLGFESDVKELVTNTIFIDCTGDTPPIKGILKKSKKDSDSTTESKKSTTETTKAKVLEFNWRSAFKGLVPHMEHCVKVVLDNVCAKNLQQEEELHSSGHISVSLSLITRPTFTTASNTHLREDTFSSYSETETPRMIAKFCGAIMTEMDALLPLAAACNESSLLQVRSSFIESCGRAAFAMLGRLQERALEVPSSAPLKNLHALLATCIYVHQRLEHYSARLKDSSTAAAKITLTPLPVQKYKDTVTAMREQLTSYYIQACYTCILQDAESHHWADPKPFYEGERCSFSVQMWFYFLCGLRSDLWAVLPAELARDVLGQVLTDTLQLLVRRYARARASYKRHLQIRCDITAMLLYVEHLMWSLCESPEALVCFNPSSVITIIAGGSDWPYQIHNLCDQLLTVLVIVTAPLSLLHRTFMIDAAKETSPDPPTIPVIRWLNAINPKVFTEQAIRDGLMGQASLACQLRLLTSDPGCNPKLLLQMLLYRDCHLPRILLENSYFCQENSSEMSTESCKEGDDFMMSLFNLFSCLNNVPKALTLALQPYLERAHIWEHLYTLAAIISLAIQALSFIFTNLPMAVASLPLPIRFLFQVAEKHLSQHARQLRLVGLLIWALLGCLIQGLEDPDTLEQISGLALDRSAKDRLSLLAECVQAAIGIQQKGVPKPSVHKVIQALEEKRPKWTQLQLQKARKLCSDSVFEQGSERGVAAAELTEQKIGLMLLEVCHKAGGSSYLRQIYHIIQGNEELLMSKLSGSSDLPNDPPLFVKFDLGPESHVGGARFNPLHQFDHIGKKKLDQFSDVVLCGCTCDIQRGVILTFTEAGSLMLKSAVVDWAWDWARLLPAYQGMSRVTFRALLANRWEMQEGAQLEDGEKAMVEELEKAFLGCCCTPGPQNPPEADETPGKQAQGKTQPSASDEGSTP
ncbi:uncharacterized protein KIAA0825 homolog isoform X4 [Pelmatolapia mariae]|uniref:uncharacterized protein KIAA0825 homolog isoform X4 n=1 Tax=Pelmatolapia mariae TaxID=158779 RepID=UPI002FE5DE51